MCQQKMTVEMQENREDVLTFVELEGVALAGRGAGGRLLVPGRVRMCPVVHGPHQAGENTGHDQNLRNIERGHNPISLSEL